jgi:Gluconate 2-dehydrogenase subunit 3
MKQQQFRTRYPGFNVLDKWSSPDWDEQTREVVRRRLEKTPPVRFFTEAEACTLAAVAERIIPQPDRLEAEKVLIVPWIDEKLHVEQRDGYRYEGLRALFDGASFAELDPLSQDVVLRHVERGDAPGAAWKRVPAVRFFTSVLCASVVKTYYAHPLAWNEIGYNGPSALRGHVRKWEGGVDPWEAQEREG